MSTNKRIAIARAIMYKELAKRQEERKIECKRRGLWALWQHQTRYKTLWHFLRASNEQLIWLCDKCIIDLIVKRDECLDNLRYYDKCYAQNPRRENEALVTQYELLYNKRSRAIDEISIIRNKLSGGNENESQN